MLEEVNWMYNNEIKIRKLCDRISNFDNFVLYGAGDVAAKLLNLLKETGNYPLYCIVTNKCGSKISICNISVYEFNEKFLELKKNKTLVIVAVTEIYEKEIEQELQSKGVNNYILISDYKWYTLSGDMQDFYMQKDFDWYCSNVCDWYYEKFGVSLDWNQYKKNTIEGNKQFVFVVEDFTPRVVKIVRALKKNGKNVLILASDVMKHSYNIGIDNELQEIADEYRIYDSVEELLFLVMQRNRITIHIFSQCCRLIIACILVKLKEHIGKVIFENYDIVNGFYTNVPQFQLEQEKYCLENADGICYREYSLEYLVNELNLKISPNTFRFWDYCSVGTFPVKESIKKELSICYAGNVITEEEYPNCPFAGFMKMANICEQNRCHFHVYPTRWDEKIYQKYIERDKNSLYFHFHKTIPYDELISELSQYDYGIVLTCDNVWDNECLGYNTKYKYIYAATNKFFDFLDAGLPIVAAIPLEMAQFLSNKGVLLKWTNEQYDFDYLLKMRETMRKDVLIVREELNIQKHIQDYIDFLETKNKG